MCSINVFNYFKLYVKKRFKMDAFIHGIAFLNCEAKIDNKISSVFY